MEQINLNLIPNGVNPVAHCKQYDVGRTFRCNLFEGNSVYTLGGTETVECEVHKPDGNLVTLGLTNTGSTYVDVTTTLQMCACSGESLAAIKITSGGVELGSLNFVLYCERSPLEGGITSDSGIYNLGTQVASLVASEVADQYDSANVIFDASPTAGHGNGYAVTSEGVKTEIDAKADATDVGTLTDLTTTDKSNVVNAINEVDGDIGNLSSLTTTANSDLVSAINEVDGDVGDLSSLTTTATSDLVSAVNEVDGDIGDLSNLTTTAKSDVVSAINELDGDIGDLTTLTTTDQSSLVGAVNELDSGKADKTALTWTLLGETTGTSEIDLPTTWNELQVYGAFGGNPNYGFTAHTIKAHIGSNPARYIQGGADKDAGTDHHIAIWHIENGKIGLNFWRYNNTDYTSTSKLIVYYR